MSVSDEQIEFITDLYAPLGTISYRKMMGGLSIYLDGQIFSILSSDGTILLKAKGAFAQRLATEGSVIFSMGDKIMGYWTLPDAAIDDPERASDWARMALAAL